MSPAFSLHRSFRPVALIAAIALFGCGSDSGSGGSAAGGSGGGSGNGGSGASGGTSGNGGTSGAGASGGTSGNGGTSAAGGSGGTGAVGGSGGEAGAASTVNGCDPATAANHLADANVDVHFPGSVPYEFTPACIRVKKGSTVTFIPDAGITFHDHAIYGGTTVDGTAPPDPASPIGPKESNDSDPLVVTLPDTGAFGYYCPYHGYLGEIGAIFVE